MEARPRKAVTVLLINLAAVVERADEGVLPAVYFFIGRSLNASLSQLGTLTLCRAVVQVRRGPRSALRLNQAAADPLQLATGGLFPSPSDTTDS